MQTISRRRFASAAAMTPLVLGAMQTKILGLQVPQETLTLDRPQGSFRKGSHVG